MRGTSLAERERAEVDALLRSGIFNRAPNLASFLQYTCARYFEGRADEIKEYNVAVEALGRRPEFDQNRDSIVRVEAYRLRRRLKQFYEGEGASHAVKIVIPNGQYAPVFLHDPAFLPEEAEPVQATDAFAPELDGGERSIPLWKSLIQRRVFWAGAACILTLAAGFGTYAGLRDGDEVWHGRAGLIGQEDFRLIAGRHGPPLHDRQGRTWQADAYYHGGRSIQVPPGKRFECVSDPEFGRSYRAGNFRYELPARSGVYELHLYFVEPEFGVGNPREADGNETARLFSIQMNGKPLLQFLDVLAEAGAPNRMHERVFRDVKNGPDGLIRLDFRGDRSAAILSALELLPSTPGTVRPLRIVAQPAPLKESSNVIWSADQYAAGGTEVQRKGNLPGPIFVGERYGNFTYHIPAAEGRYRLNLYFAETYFGTDLIGNPTSNPFGQRSFNVFANGVALLREFDIARAAGGSNRAVRRSFDDIEPNAQGKIVLEFNPVRNYAEVNAIELLPMNAASPGANGS